MKTVENDTDPALFLSRGENRGRADDAAEVVEMMTRVTGYPPRMWGDSIIGFGRYHYTRKDGSAHSFFRTGVSPRKQNLTIYIMPGFAAFSGILARLGPHRHSSSCLYLGRLKAVDQAVLEELVRASVAEMDRRYPPD